MAVEYKCCETEFFVHIAVIVFLVVFAGLMSGLTLGLMSLSLVDLEVLAKSGTPKDKKYAGIIYFYVLLAYFVRLLVDSRASSWVVKDLIATPHHHLLLFYLFCFREEALKMFDGNFVS